MPCFPQNILTQSQLHALSVPGKLPGPYNSLQDLKLLNRTTTTASNVTNSLHSTTVGVSNHDLDRVCSTITGQFLTRLCCGEGAGDWML